MTTHYRHCWWVPRSTHLARRIDRIAVRVGRVPARCTVCGHPTLIRVRHENLRESCDCSRCGAFNRQRQLAYVVCGGGDDRYRSLRHLARHADLTVYNAEASGAVHRMLRGMRWYMCSEYLGDDVPGGTIVDSLVHQDLQRMSFESESIDLVLSADVLEHVPDPYAAHAEVYRVLRPGGRHVFTVPYEPASASDDIRARRDESGGLVLLKEPQYHDDPLRPDGALVYTIFGQEMATRLQSLGFSTTIHHLHKPWLGILGDNGFVFEAVRP